MKDLCLVLQKKTTFDLEAVTIAGELLKVIGIPLKTFYNTFPIEPKQGQSCTRFIKRALHSPSKTNTSWCITKVHRGLDSHQAALGLIPGIPDNFSLEFFDVAGIY